MKGIIKKMSIRQIEEMANDETFSDADWKSEFSNDDEFSDLVKAIEEGYRIENVPKHMKKTSFAPSGLVYGHGICPRYWYLAFEGNEFYEYKTGKAITNMDSGTDRHNRIEKALVDINIALVKTKEEKKISYDDPPIFGYIDSLINWKDSEYVVEIKTCPDEAFERHKKSNSASSYHIIQLLIYMKILKKKYGIILYENKNTHELLAIPVNITQRHVDFVDYLFDWMREVYSAWTDKKLPKVPFKNNDIKICQSCPLQSACKAAAEGDIKIARRKDEKGQF